MATGSAVLLSFNQLRLIDRWVSHWSEVAETSGIEWRVYFVAQWTSWGIAFKSSSLRESAMMKLTTWWVRWVVRWAMCESRADSLMSNDRVCPWVAHRSWHFSFHSSYRQYLHLRLMQRGRLESGRPCCLLRTEWRRQSIADFSATSYRWEN